MSRVISEFEDVCSTGLKASDKFHHEDTPAFEKRFRTHAKKILRLNNKFSGKQMLNIMNEEEHTFACSQLVAIGSQNLIAP